MKVFTGNRVLFALCVVIAALVFLRVAAPDALPSLFELLGEDMTRALTREYFAVGSVKVSPLLLLEATFYILLLTILAKLSKRFVRKRILRFTSMDEGQRYALERMTAYVVFTVGLMITLQSLGVNLSSVAWLGGAIGVGIGFGLQPIASNFISGLILLAERPIKVGDLVEVGGTSGIVMRIGARATWIRAVDNAVILIPNSEFVTGRVRNWTLVEKKARYSVKVTVSYDCDPEKVRDLLVSAALAHPDVLKSPPPDVILQALGENGLQFELRVWTTNQVLTPPVLASDLHFSILGALRRSGFEIPVPQRDLRVRSVAGPIKVSQIS